MNDKKVNKKLFDKISSKITEDLKNSSDDPRLVDITPLEEFSEDIQAILSALYQNPDPRSKRFATILNAIYTHTNNVFVLTHRLAADLVLKDPNYTQKSCDGTSYKKMLSFALQNLYLNVLRSPVRKEKGVTGKAGLYELSDSDFLAPLIEMIGVTTCKANKDAKLKWYDENNQVIDTESIEVPAEIMAERSRVREFAKELERKRNGR